MTEKFPQGGAIWQMATPEDIAKLVENGEVDRARQWCERKLFEISRLLLDIDSAREKTVELGEAAWKEKRTEIEALRDEWSAIYDSLRTL